MAIDAGIVKDGKLVPKEEWISYIESLQNSLEDVSTDIESAKKAFADAFLEAVKKRCSSKFAVLLSGGVDSSYIALACKKLGYTFPCYTVGLENSKDVAVAKELAKEYDLDLHVITVTKEELEPVFLRMLKLIEEPDVVKVEVGAVELVALDRITKDGYFHVFGGLGSEEIFAGYQRHEVALEEGDAALHDECWDGMKGMWDRDLVRDTRVGAEYNVTLLTPFLDRAVIESAMKIHPKFKITSEDKKIVLREIAEEFGLKHEYAFRKKIAAQYGSNFDDALEKIAKKKGMKKKEFLINSLHM